MGAPFPYMAKTLKIFSGTKRPTTLKLCMQHQVLKYYEVYSNDDHALTLTFYSKVKFVPLCVCMGTHFNSRFPRNYWSLWTKRWHIKSIKWAHEDLWVPKVKVIHWFLSSHPDLINFKHFFQTPQGRSKLNFMWSLHGKGELKSVKIVQVTWPRRSPWPYLVKTFTNLLWNPLADVLEPCCIAPGTHVLPSLSKLWP